MEEKKDKTFNIFNSSKFTNLLLVAKLGFTQGEKTEAKCKINKKIISKKYLLKEKSDSYLI